MKVNNISKNAKRYIVAREVDGELWYWGSWDDAHEANKAAANINGVVVENN